MLDNLIDLNYFYDIYKTYYKSGHVVSEILGKETHLLKDYLFNVFWKDFDFKFEKIYDIVNHTITFIANSLKKKHHYSKTYVSLNKKDGFKFIEQMMMIYTKEIIKGLHGIYKEKFKIFQDKRDIDKSIEMNTNLMDLVNKQNYNYKYFIKTTRNKVYENSSQCYKKEIKNLF
jgi:hypothetical protein